MLASTILAASLSIATIPIKIDQNVNGFISDLSSGNIHCHKSGLMGKNVGYQSLGKAVSGPNELNSSAAIPEWKSLSNQLYVSKPDTQICRQLGIVISKRIGSISNKKIRFFADEMFINDEHADSAMTMLQFNDSTFDFQNNLAFYQSISDSILSDLKGAIEFDNFEIVTQNNKQVSIGIRYRRIFRGGVPSHAVAA